MTSRERVLTALKHEPPDRVPRDFWAEEPAWNRLLAHAGYADKERLLRQLGTDLRHLDAQGPAERPIGDGTFQNLWGERLSFQGGIDMQKLLPFGTPEQVQAEARRYGEVLGQGSGYLLGPAHVFQPDVPPENVLPVYSHPAL